MRTAVIHRPERLDRCKAVGALHDAFPDLALIVAQVPEWEQDKSARAVRGCSLSHLLGVRHFLTPDAPALIFEDDAVAYAPGVAAWETVKDRIPADAGIVLLGGETEQVSPSGEFREVLGKYWGTHAVLYMPALTRSPFLVEAYALLASRPVGQPSAGQLGLCYESVLLQAVYRSGLKVYRPEVMAYTTLESLSERDGVVAPPRTKNLHLD